MLVCVLYIYFLSCAVMMFTENLMLQMIRTLQKSNKTKFLARFEEQAISIDIKKYIDGIFHLSMCFACATLY